jgi:hypothetical protein
MKATGEKLVVKYLGKDVSIEIYVASREKVYKVNLPVILFITKSINRDTNEEFWTSVPEGRLQEAGLIGKLIDERRIIPKQESLF